MSNDMIPDPPTRKMTPRMALFLLLVIAVQLGGIFLLASRDLPEQDAPGHDSVLSDATNPPGENEDNKIGASP